MRFTRKFNKKRTRNNKYNNHSYNFQSKRLRKYKTKLIKGGVGSNDTLGMREVENELDKELNKASNLMTVENAQPRVGVWRLSPNNIIFSDKKDIVERVMKWSNEALAIAKKVRKPSDVVVSKTEKKVRKSSSVVVSNTAKKVRKSSSVEPSKAIVESMVENAILKLLNNMTGGGWQNMNSVILDDTLNAGQEYAAEAAYRYAHNDEIDQTIGIKPFRQYPGRGLFLSKFAAKMARKKIKKYVYINKIAKSLSLQYNIPADVVFNIAEMAVSDSDDDDDEANKAAKKAWAKINVETSFNINRDLIDIIIQRAITNYTNSDRISRNSKTSHNSIYNNIKSEWNEWWVGAVIKIKNNCDEFIKEINESTKPLQKVTRQILSEIIRRTITIEEKDAVCEYALNEIISVFWDNIPKKI